MDLDRRSIEKRDFPQGRRGYDTGAVDRHLSAVADAVEKLIAERGAAPAQASLAGAAASQVEAIVAAAEASAREIEQRARSEAAETVERLVARADEMRREVEELVGRIAALKNSLDGPAQPSPAPPSPAPPARPAVAPIVPETPEPDPEVVVEAEAQVRDSGAGSGRPEEGARLIALNMALNGTPRDETARYLRENYDLQAPDELLDEVYARAGS